MYSRPKENILLYFKYENNYVETEYTTTTPLLVPENPKTSVLCVVSNPFLIFTLLSSPFYVNKSECIISARRWSQFGRKQNASEISCREFSLLAYFYHIQGVILNLTWKNSLYTGVTKILSYGFFSFFLHKGSKNSTRFQYFYSSHTNLNLSKGKCDNFETWRTA